MFPIYSSTLHAPNTAGARGCIRNATGIEAAAASHSRGTEPIQATFALPCNFYRIIQTLDETGDQRKASPCIPGR